MDDSEISKSKMFFLYSLCNSRGQETSPIELKQVKKMEMLNTIYFRVLCDYRIPTNNL